MRLRNLVTIRRPVDDVWDALLGVDREGALSVKVGATAVEFRGTLRFADVDQASRRIVVHATGTARDGNQASATVTASLTPSGAGTAVALETDLAVGGKLAQFGAGVMTDVAADLVKQFAARLEAAPPRAAPSAPSPAPAAPAVAPTAHAAASPPPPPVDWKLAAGMIAVLAATAWAGNRKVRWALAAVGAGLVVARQRSSSST